ncbi:MAG: hypothetical protein WBB85_13300 [Albidovulum sp.]|uniref:hypothetical protein n=1 Tax=Albidovulum sp. TaxID=1872424 RepID=UPI003CA7FA94
MPQTVFSSKDQVQLKKLLEGAKSGFIWHPRLGVVKVVSIQDKYGCHDQLETVDLKWEYEPDLEVPFWDTGHP